MADHWISAEQALNIAGDSNSLCTRLHAGLIRARARVLSTEGQTAHGANVPRSFWWAKGGSALVQDWGSGDFTTWIEQKQEVSAFGVQFPLTDVLAMAPFERRAIIAHQLSIAGSPDWISARAARKLVYDHFGHNPMTAASAILEAARLGFLSARAVLAQGSSTIPTPKTWEWEEREWDIPTWFWTRFTAVEAAQDWELGRFSGKGQAPDGTRSMALSGVHFFRASLDALGQTPPPEEAPTSNRGRKPKYDWIAATNACWGLVYRGDASASTQSDIERLLIDLLRNGDDEPGESSVRPYASQIWSEASKA